MLRRFSFRLAAPYAAWVAANGDEVANALGINLGTMGPKNLLEPGLSQKFEGYPKPSFGLHLHAMPRQLPP